MGLFIKKAFGKGPLRLNLSKSGLGLSLGIKGLRVSAGPKGVQLNAGRKGLYYRQSLNGKNTELEGQKGTKDLTGSNVTGYIILFSCIALVVGYFTNYIGFFFSLLLGGLIYAAIDFRQKKFLKEVEEDEIKRLDTFVSIKDFPISNIQLPEGFHKYGVELFSTESNLYRSLKRGPVFERECFVSITDENIVIWSDEKTSVIKLSNVETISMTGVNGLLNLKKVSAQKPLLIEVLKPLEFLKMIEIVLMSKSKLQ